MLSGSMYRRNKNRCGTVWIWRNERLMKQQISQYLYFSVSNSFLDCGGEFSHIILL